jgi:methylated-DNA-[protein]-cysteine S-methyltransferase
MTTDTMPGALMYTTVKSPIGKLLLVGDGESLQGLYMQDAPRPRKIDPSWEHSAEPFADVEAQLDEYFTGRRSEFDVRLALHGNPFQLRVWDELRRIPCGTTTSYGELARRIGNPEGARAVGLANGQNPVSVIVPCHRVIGADGKLVGYGGGLERKRLLLELEAGVMQL